MPYLSNEIYDHNQANESNADVFKPNLKGFMVGNGVTNWDYDTNTAYLDMAYWHSLIDEDMHEKFVALNCDWNMPYMIGVSDECMNLFNEFNTLVAGVNVYDIFGTCWGAGPYPQFTEQGSGFPHLYNGGSGKKQH